MATIITKNSQTASAVPAASSLEVGELAVNTADGKLYTEHTGGVVKEIIPSTVVDGGITAAKIATNAVTSDKINASAVTEAKIADGAVTTNKLSNTGVTAGTYATATVTVDAKGRITAASAGSGGGVTSLNGQTGAITNTNTDAIGSYIAAVRAVGAPGGGQTSRASVGSTIAGSTLRYNYDITYGNDIGGAHTAGSTSYNGGGSSLSGTWRCVSRDGVFNSGYNIYWYAGLWVRVS
jgi:hypothetical protein